MENTIFERVKERALWLATCGLEDNIFNAVSNSKEWDDLERTNQDKILALVIRHCHNYLNAPDPDGIAFIWSEARTFKNANFEEFDRDSQDSILAMIIRRTYEQGCIEINENGDK